jgi:hypothetical protein
MAFMPLIERSGEIDFYLLKSLPYYPRLYLALGLFVLGLTFQVALLSVAPGIYFIWGAILLILAKGYRSTCAPGGSTFWKEVDWRAFEEVKKTNDRNKRWDSIWLDITSLKGLILLLVVGVHVVPLYFFAFMGAENLYLIYVADVFSVLVPVWCTGIRRGLTQDRLIIKVEELLAIKKRYESLLERNGDSFVPMMETTAAEGGDKEVPTDVHLRLRYKDMPKDYYGLQAQVVINEVQGRCHPYFYCVLVAAVGKVDWHEFRKPATDREIILEFKQQRDVEVLVIRQRTTQKSGYDVDRKTASKIFGLAYARGRGINSAIK